MHDRGAFLLPCATRCEDSEWFDLGHLPGSEGCCGGRVRFRKECPGVPGGVETIEMMGDVPEEHVKPRGHSHAFLTDNFE